MFFVRPPSPGHAGDREREVSEEQGTYPGDEGNKETPLGASEEEKKKRECSSFARTMAHQIVSLRNRERNKVKNREEPRVTAGQETQLGSSAPGLPRLRKGLASYQLEREERERESVFQCVCVCERECVSEARGMQSFDAGALLLHH